VATQARNGVATGRGGIRDWYAFTVSFKGVLLEGLEVGFIVLTFGSNQHDIPLAASPQTGRRDVPAGPRTANICLESVMSATGSGELLQWPSLDELLRNPPETLPVTPLANRPDRSTAS
jgi:hypothetical protein